MMEERVHATCEGLGKKFTFKEWSAYLKDHDSRDTAYSVGKYDYNIHDVCLNPDKEMLYQSKVCFLEVSTAIGKDNKWTYGVNYSTQPNGCGGGFGAGWRFAKYESKEDAIRNCVEWYIPKLERELSMLSVTDIDIDDNGIEHKVNNTAKIKAYKTAIQELKSRLTDGVQLTLF